MTAPLTPAELAELERDVTETNRMPPHYGHVKRLIAEVRASRELLATADLCGWPKPQVVDLPLTYGKPGERGVAWELLDEPDDEPLTPDEAIAIGTALIRAALAARARAGRGVDE